MSAGKGEGGENFVLHQQGWEEREEKSPPPRSCNGLHRKKEGKMRSRGGRPRKNPGELAFVRSSYGEKKKGRRLGPTEIRHKKLGSLWKNAIKKGGEDFRRYQAILNA